MGSAAPRRGAYAGEYMRAELRLHARGGKRLDKRTSQTRAKESYISDNRTAARAKNLAPPHALVSSFLYRRLRKGCVRSLHFVAFAWKASRHRLASIASKRASPIAGASPGRASAACLAPSSTWPARLEAQAGGPGGHPGVRPSGAVRPLARPTRCRCAVRPAQAGQSAQAERGARPSRRLPPFFLFFAFFFLQFV
jgi:hypothetical protein